MPPGRLQTKPTRIVVVKIGGASLFSTGIEFDRLVNYVESLKTDQANRHFIILGGGDTVESMRTLHRNHPHLDLTKMHWRCVELLQGTCDVAAELLGLEHRLVTTDQLDDAMRDPTARSYLVDVTSFYQKDSIGWIPPDLVPAENWDTTSDTLAWLLALRLRADELQLIKKPDCQEVSSIEQAACLGIVDPQFAILAKKQPQNWKLDTLVVYHTVGWKTKLLAAEHPYRKIIL
jgi:aspartokinase-like uncharacterized kinase